MVPVQKHQSGAYKKYTVLYFVYEKVAQCGHYPPDQQVTFEDIKVFCSGRQVFPKWTTSYVEDVCNFRAQVVSNSSIRITWNTTAADPTPEQFAKNAKSTLKKPSA